MIVVVVSSCSRPITSVPQQPRTCDRHAGVFRAGNSTRGRGSRAQYESIACTTVCDTDGQGERSGRILCMYARRRPPCKLNGKTEFAFVQSRRELKLTQRRRRRHCSKRVARFLLACVGAYCASESALPLHLRTSDRASGLHA